VSEPAACARCLGRTWLLTRLAGHLDMARQRIQPLLQLGDGDLIATIAGNDELAVRRELAAFDPEPARARCVAAGLGIVCRCDPAYPPSLRTLAAPPAVLHVAGGLERFLELSGEPMVAVVGARRASPYSLETARSLARGVASRGVTVVSGMAFGVDAAAHEGAIEGGGRTIAVLPAAPERAYPAAAGRLHRRILAASAAVSELGPGVPVRRWMFPARNRIIAAASAMTVVVAARQGSGAILTARLASELGRELGAVPGQVTAPLSWGPHELLRAGARLVAEPRDVLAALPGAGASATGAATRPSLGPGLQPLLDAIADGHELPAALDLAGLDIDAGLAALASLELAGRVRRQDGGRFSVVS
jgi:DNA processing protein